MAFFNLFTGPTAEKLEQKGDLFVDTRSWGKAKLLYERALTKLEKESAQETDVRSRIQHKIEKTKEALAQEHRDTAEDLIEGGHLDEAQALLDLSAELTADTKMIQSLDALKNKIQSQLYTDVPQFDAPPAVVMDSQDTPDELFITLCHTLPEEVQNAYLNYGDDFKIGYIALNNGDFSKAASHLERALEANDGQTGYIPLELATAYLHLNKRDSALRLLEALIEEYPDTLPAYQMLCEIYWEQQAFPKALGLIAAVPSELATSKAVLFLKGETLFHSGAVAEAQKHYETFLDQYGWDEPTGRALARIYETMGNTEKALPMYRKILQQCTSCHARIDPFIKEKYADLNFSEGVHTTEVLELYLSLAQEMPEKATEFFAKISKIYHTQGNETEANRFDAMSRR